MKTASFGKLLCKERGFTDEKQVVGKRGDRIQKTVSRMERQEFGVRSSGLPPACCGTRSTGQMNLFILIPTKR